MKVRGLIGEVILPLVYEILLFQGRSIGKLVLIVNYGYWHDVGSNLYRS